METANVLSLDSYCPVKAQNAGLFISRGVASHPTRIIQSHELIFVKQGELDMWEAGQVFHLKAGQTLHLWPQREHGGAKPLPQNLKFYWLHFETRPSRGGRRGHEEVAPAVKIPQVTTITQPERLERLFRTFLDDQETGALHTYSANLLTMLILSEVAQSALEKSADSPDLNVVATWAHTFIRINYERPITTSTVAEALGYNADYLGRIYRREYGVTLTEAIHRRRIGVASDYLLDTNLTIEQIAQKCGFIDPDYFRRVFRRYMQISPGDYRKEYARTHVNTH